METFSRFLENIQNLSKTLPPPPRVCSTRGGRVEVWLAWTQCDRMWQMHSLVSLFSCCCPIVTFPVFNDRVFEGEAGKRWHSKLNSKRKLRNRIDLEYTKIGISFLNKIPMFFLSHKSDQLWNVRYWDHNFDQISMRVFSCGGLTFPQIITHPRGKRDDINNI